MRFLSLFAGIGGFDLGLERASMQCVGQVEIEPFCQKVLAKHWPNVWRWNDVKTLTGEIVRQNCGAVDLLCGGVPCQPASVAGKRKGADDHRWLWPDFLRVVSEINPVWVLAENPRGVLSLDVGGVQFSEWIANEFAARGYELLPFKLAAEDVGAPHRRERVFFVAYSSGLQSERRRELGNLACETRATEGNSAERKRMWHAAFNCGSDVADAGFSGDDFARRKLSQTKAGVMDDAAREQDWRLQFGKLEANSGTASQQVANASNARLERQRNGAVSASADFGGYQWPARPGQPQHGWEQPRTVELPLGGAVAGLPVRLVRRHRVSALKALGNAIVPQVAEVIGRAILQMEAA